MCVCVGRDAGGTRVVRTRNVGTKNGDGARVRVLPNSVAVAELQKGTACGASAVRAIDRSESGLGLSSQNEVDVCPPVRPSVVCTNDFELGVASVLRPVAHPEPEAQGNATRLRVRGYFRVSTRVGGGHLVAHPAVCPPFGPPSNGNGAGPTIAQARLLKSGLLDPQKGKGGGGGGGLHTGTGTRTSARC